MKIKEEILRKHYSKILPNHSKYRKRKDYFAAMDKYASLREVKWRELYEVQKELQKLTEKIFGLSFDEIYRKHELYQKVKLLEQELELTDKK
jgi:hypothetical protein